MNSSEFVLLWDQQYPLFKELQRLRKSIGISPSSVHLLQVMDARRGSGRIFNPSKLIKDYYSSRYRWLTIKWLRENGYITKLGKFEYRFEDKAVSFVDEFNTRLGMKIDSSNAARIK